MQTKYFPVIIRNISTFLTPK